MADGPEKDAPAGDAERLRRLEARLAERSGPPPGPRGEEHFAQANLAWRMVSELVAGLGIGFGIGFGLDRLFGTMPVLMVVFVLLGLVAGIRTMMRTAGEIGKASGQPGDHRGD
jgi:ATP synthase protein I